MARISVVLPEPLGPSNPVTPGREAERDARQDRLAAAADVEIADHDCRIDRVGSGAIVP
jgi:hypothetical protein